MKNHDDEQHVTESNDNEITKELVDKRTWESLPWKEKHRIGDFEDTIRRYEKQRKRMQRPSDQLDIFDHLKKDAIRFEIDHLVPEGMIFLPEVLGSQYRYAEKIAEGNTNVLIEGDTGTGKTDLAEFIHMHSNQNEGEFVHFNASLYSNKEHFQAMLFGARKGSYTDANQDRPGIIETPNLGTLFIDEIDKLDLYLQGLLLTVIETGEYRWLGENKTQTTNCRFLFGTNADLKSLIDANKFLPDLYWRIQHPKVRTVPFREWPKALFFERLLKSLPRSLELNQSSKSDQSPKEKPLSKRRRKFAADRTLKEVREYFDEIYWNVQNQTNNFSYWNDYSWPGNVREFLVYVQVALITNDWKGYFSQKSVTNTPATPKTPFLIIEDPVDKRELMRRYAKALLSSEGLVKHAAEKAALKGRMSPTTVRKWAKPKNDHDTKN